MTKRLTGVELSTISRAYLGGRIKSHIEGDVIQLLGTFSVTTASLCGLIHRLAAVAYPTEPETPFVATFTPTMIVYGENLSEAERDYIHSAIMAAEIIVVSEFGFAHLLMEVAK